VNSLHLHSERGLIGVAAGVLAATLIAKVCREAEPNTAASARAETAVAENEFEVVELPTRWLIPPDPDLEPPVAAPLGIAVDQDNGRLLLLELQPPELRSYSLISGQLLNVMGREGDGPGEYRNPIGLAVNVDGLAAVLSASGRVTFWDPDGSLAGTVQTGPGLATDILAARADTFYVKSDLFPPQDFSVFRLVTPDTAFADARYRDVDLASVSEPGRGLKNHAYAVAATRRGEILLSPPGPDYLILRIAADGGTQRRIVRPEIGPLQRDAKEIEAIRERVRKGFAAAGRPTPAFIPVPEYRPHLACLAVAPDGSIWALTQRGDEGVSVLDYFGPDGRYVATYAVGRRVSAIAVTTDRLLLLARGADDVHGVAVAERPAAKPAQSVGG
jgi:hypothetical protein